MEPHFIGLIIFMASIFGARALNDKANRELSTEKKAELVDLFSRNYKNYIIILVIIGGFFAAMQFELLEMDILLSIYGILLLIFMIFSSINSKNKLIKNDFPITYINKFLLSSVIRFIGISVMFAFLAAK